MTDFFQIPPPSEGVLDTSQGLPHGLIPPPKIVQDIVAQETAKFLPEIVAPEAVERMICDLTLQYYFEVPGYEVAYRSTPQGPDVIAFGPEEMNNLYKQLSPEEWRTIRTWMP